jgi:hypothetical protein
MDLDRRARQAADALHQHVEGHLDVSGARSALDAVGVRRRREVRQARVGAGLVVMAAALIGWALFSSGGFAGPDGDPNREVADSNRDGRTDKDREVLQQLPAGPIDGKASWRLPVLLEPQSGVAEGDTVTLYGRGFEPDESLGIVHCTAEADVDNAGVNACDLGTAQSTFGHVQYATASSDGTVVAHVEVRRFITTPGQGEVDCASAPERCIIAVAAVANYDRSGGSYIQFDAAPDFPDPQATLSPAGELIPGQQVQVQLTQWPAKRATRVQQCIEDQCEDLLDGKAGPEGTYAATVTVNGSIIVDGQEIPCDGRCVLRVNGIGLKGQSSQKISPDLPLTFAAPEAGATTTTHPAPTTATTTTSPPATTAPPGTATTAPTGSPCGPDVPEALCDTFPTTTVTGGP